MSDKEKRKSNPRRRFLIRLILGIGIVMALISVGIYALRPKGAQIVFIAPDDNGVDNIWIADLDNPENPRQLTFHERKGMGGISRLQASARGDVITYHYSWYENGNYPEEIRVIDLSNNQHKTINYCDIHADCSYQLSPDGRWLLDYQESFDGQSRIFSLYIYNLQTDERIPINESSTRPDIQPLYHVFPYVQWLDNNELVAYSASADSSEYYFYNIEQQQVIKSIQEVRSPLFFSPDGLHHYFYDGYTGNFEITVSSDSIQDVIVSPFYIIGWHPDSQYLLVTNDIVPRNDDTAISTYLFDIRTQGLVFLFIQPDGEWANFGMQFNHNGTQILYDRFNESYEMGQIMLYDMETGEEIALPLFGHSPQWVNGGR